MRCGCRDRHVTFELKRKIKKKVKVMNGAVELGPMMFDLPHPTACLGTAALRATAAVGRTGVERMHALIASRTLPPRLALIGRIRGTGPGVSFGLLVRAMEVRYPQALQRPFEGSHNVSGGCIDLAALLHEEREDAFLRLHFRPGCTDLPMHAHEHADRLLFVTSGRGFFHVASESLSDFSGTCIRHIPVRSRDVIVFPRGTIHTFSTTSQSLKLLSYHPTHIPLEDARQFTIPSPLTFPASLVEHDKSQVSCDPAFSIFG